MKRHGFFTGKVYGDSCYDEDITECCTQITDTQAQDEGFLSQKHLKDLAVCMTCWGCPESQKSKCL